MVKFYVRMLLAAMLFIPSAAKADDATVLRVNYNNGERVDFAFADKPTATFKTDSITVASTANTVQAEMSAVKDFKFLTDAEATGISAIRQNGARITAGNAYLSNLAEGETVRVYTANGQQVLAAKADGGNVKLDLNSLGRGVYIISTSTTNTKVLVK